MASLKYMYNILTTARVCSVVKWLIPCITVGLIWMLIPAPLEKENMKHTLKKWTWFEENKAKSASERWDSFSFDLETRYLVLKERDYTHVKGKKFVYLSQGPTVPKGGIKGLKETPQRDVFWLTFADKTGDIYAPKGTSLSAGRNALLRYAVHLASQTPDKGYLYYIFADDDVVLSVRNSTGVNWKPWEEMSNDPFQRFEEFLLYFQPAVSYGVYPQSARQNIQIVKPNTPANVNWIFDDCFVAFHRDTLSFVLPWDTYFDYNNWLAAPFMVRQMPAILYHSYRYQCNSISVVNPVSDRPISKEEYLKHLDFRQPVKYTHKALLKYQKQNREPNELRNAVLLQGEVGDGYQGPNGAVPGEPKMKSRNISYLVTDPFIENFWDLTQPLVQQKLSWRANPDVRKILDLDRPDAFPPFVADSIYCTGPQKCTVTPLT